VAAAAAQQELCELQQHERVCLTPYFIPL
jgi:hypothetical protein